MHGSHFYLFCWGNLGPCLGLDHWCNTQLIWDGNRTCTIFLSYLEVVTVHPRNQSINEEANICTINRIAWISKISDEIIANLQLAFCVGCRQERLEAIQILRWWWLSCHTGWLTFTAQEYAAQTLRNSSLWGGVSSHMTQWSGAQYVAHNIHSSWLHGSCKERKVEELTNSSTKEVTLMLLISKVKGEIKWVWKKRALIHDVTCDKITLHSDPLTSESRLTD